MSAAATAPTRTKRAKRETETPDYAKMLRRMIRRYATRVADADYVDLAEMLAVRDELDQAIHDAVAGQREAGASWSVIGAGLGITRQAAQVTYGRRSRRSVA